MSVPGTPDESSYVALSPIFQKFLGQLPVFTPIHLPSVLLFRSP